MDVSKEEKVLRLKIRNWELEAVTKGGRSSLKQILKWLGI